MQGKLETRVGFFVLAALAIFIYMGFEIGAFRFDRNNYQSFTASFSDISGLSRKADVKIAGVKVGWVESITLLENGEIKAEAEMMVLKKYQLYADAYAIVRQDGFLGPKYVELIPGDPLLHPLEVGGQLGKPSTSPVSIDEIMQHFKQIAVNVNEITDSFKEVVGGVDGKEQLRSIFDNLNITAAKLSNFADIVDRSISRNEQNIDLILSMGKDLKQLTEKLDLDFFPAVESSIEKIASIFDRDLAHLSQQLDVTAQALNDVSLQARDGLRSISSVAEKIDDGKGLIGKLINEDSTYTDLKTTIQGIKNYLTKLDRLQIVFDAHSEAMIRRAENYIYEDTKGYFDVRVYPNDDYFYLLQIVSSQKGFRYAKDTDYEFFDAQGSLVSPDAITLGNNAFLLPFFRASKNKYKRNQFLFGLQVGKIFNNIALRFGLIENSAGVAVDIDIPFNTDKFRWITTLELFDMSGWNRLDDRRPHAKWINRMFLLRNVYFNFGADDFVSKRNASVFFGAGLRFGDDEVKYILSSISGAGSSLCCLPNG